MKLTDELKENVKKAENKEQAKKPIAKAGIILSDDELDQVAGGDYGDTSFFRVCSRCGNAYLGICSCDPLNPFRDQGPIL